jgi:glycosyltransferase involved in cell wall biosynthesis
MSDIKRRSHPMISVIIPFLAPGPFLEEAIQSVIGQSHRDWELLLVDDGATDGSADVARGYAKRDPERILYLTHPGRQNYGVSASRNLGLRKALGAYVAFLDADDVWMPNKLERQLQLIEAHPEAAMVYGPAITWHSWTGRPEDQERDTKQYLAMTGVFPPPSLVGVYLRGVVVIPSASAVLVRRQSVLAVGGFVDAFRFPLYDDLVLYIKLALRESILITEEVYYSYRQHPTSGVATALKVGLERQIQLQFLAWLREYTAEKNITDFTLEKIIAEQLWDLMAVRGFSGILRNLARAGLPSGLRQRLRSGVTSSRALYRTIRRMGPRKSRATR